MATVPAGPWVLVIGCHRSGTSAVTGALVALGLQGVDAADRIEHTASNPEHWESASATQYSEDLLAGLGGAWDAPPPAADEPLLPDPDGECPDPAAVLSAAYPGPGPIVWKDPRACLLLPYWRSVLPGPLAAVLVWREPLAVARSLHTRDGMSLVDGLALWERYNRSAVSGLQGVDTYVLDYASVLDDPTTALGALVTWLGGLEQFAGTADGWDVDAATAVIDPQLRHESGDGDDEVLGLYDGHQAVADWLTDHAGPHAPLADEAPGPTSPWPEILLADRRELAEVRRVAKSAQDAFYDMRGQTGRANQAAVEARATLEALVRSREAQLASARHEAHDLRYEVEGERMRVEGLRAELDRVLSSTSWTVTKPLRAVVARVTSGRG